MKVFGRKCRVTDCIKPGDSVLIRFDRHGMGDCVMFRPLYDRLKKLFPSVIFNLKCNNGQEYFEEITEKHYDMCFDIVFPEFNNYSLGYCFNGMSKPEICCKYELGIEFSRDLEFTWKPKKIIDSGIDVPSNTIGLAFQVTSNPKKSISEDVANLIWNKVKEFGFNPLEVHFSHKLANQQNKMYKFIDNTCRGYSANIDSCVDVINKCKGFIGVNTGTFCMATAMKDGNVLHMYKIYHFCPNYKRFDPVQEINCKNKQLIDFGCLENYLTKLT